MHSDNERQLTYEEIIQWLLEFTEPPPDILEATRGWDEEYALQELRRLEAERQANTPRSDDRKKYQALARFMDDKRTRRRLRAKISANVKTLASSLIRDSAPSEDGVTMDLPTTDPEKLATHILRTLTSVVSSIRYRCPKDAFPAFRVTRIAGTIEGKWEGGKRGPVHLPRIISIKAQYAGFKPGAATWLGAAVSQGLLRGDYLLPGYIRRRRKNGCSHIRLFSF
jgi:hypothetical protein